MHSKASRKIIEHNFNVHAPTELKEGDEKDQFYDKLAKIYSKTPSRNIKNVLGDSN